MSKENLMNRTMLSFVAACFIGAGGIALYPTTAAAAETPTSRPAETDRPRRPAPLARIREAIEKLELTADQKTQIETILKDAHTQIEAIRGQGDRKEAREKVQAVVKEVR